jgi:hypothetical protein
MNLTLPKAAVEAVLPVRAPEDSAARILDAAERLCAFLEKGVLIEACILRKAMEAAFDGSDTAGLWTWKTAYEACEAAQVLFLRKYGTAMQARGRNAGGAACHGRPCGRAFADSYAPYARVRGLAAILNACALGSGRESRRHYRA